ncbi:MAG: hypothetical protein WC518_03790 [Patescibacteria group bacterium]
MKKRIIGTLLAVAALTAFALPAVVLASPADTNFGLNNLENVQLGKQDLTETISLAINAILGILGIIAVLLILWGGFIWMTAAGADEKVEKAKKLIYSGIIGLVIILAAWAIAAFVISQIATATGAGNP